MKTKKSISLILALAMVLALSCSAWAAFLTADGVALGPADGASNDITQTGDALSVLYALNPNGSITYTGGTISITGDVVGTTSSKGAYAYNFGKIIGTGNVVASGEEIRGLHAYQSGDITWIGDVSATGKAARGVDGFSGTNVDITGDILVDGASAHGLYMQYSSFGKMKGDVTAYGTGSVAVVATRDSLIQEFIGNVISSGDASHAIAAYHGSVVYAAGDVSLLGPNSHGVVATQESSLTLKDGSILVDDATSYAMYIGTSGTINLENVTTECESLLVSGSNLSSSDGTVNVSDGSVLTGHILHSGLSVGTIEINITDSTWDGSAEASGDIGTIDVTLVGSDWNITGDSNTNGKVTADEDSNIDFRGTDENIVVEIDSLAGAPGLNIKLGDELIIKNQTGNTPSTTTPDIISIVENSDGSISIIPNGDGTGNLTYQYVDENGGIQTVTIGVVSGSGVKPAGGSGGSSGCNAGFGVLALMGLAFVYKKK